MTAESCPFCGSTEIGFDEHEACMGCRSCGAHGPYGDAQTDRAMATEAWNRRPVAASIHEEKPCPFCGCGDVEFDEPGACMSCERCGAQGPFLDEKDQTKATEQWNSRV